MLEGLLTTIVTGACVSDKICAPVSKVLLRGKEMEGSWRGQGTADHSCSPTGNPASAFPLRHRNKKGGKFSSIPDRTIKYCYTALHKTLPQSKLGKTHHFCTWCAIEMWPARTLWVVCSLVLLCIKWNPKLQCYGLCDPSTALYPASLTPEASLTPSHFQLCRPW